jgi:hypothetical protein
MHQSLEGQSHEVQLPCLNRNFGTGPLIETRLSLGVDRRNSGCENSVIIGGGIAAFNPLDLIRRLRERGRQVTPVLTKRPSVATPQRVGFLALKKIYQDLFDLNDGARWATSSLTARDLVVAPDGKLMAHRPITDFLATWAFALATDERVLGCSYPQ